MAATIFLKGNRVLDVDFIKVDLKDNTTKQGKNFHMVCPHGCIPAQELDNGDMLMEDIFIVQYLADLRAFNRTQQIEDLRLRLGAAG